MPRTRVPAGSTAWLPCAALSLLCGALMAGCGQGGMLEASDAASGVDAETGQPDDSVSPAVEAESPPVDAESPEPSGPTPTAIPIAPQTTPAASESPTETPTSTPAPSESDTPESTSVPGAEPTDGAGLEDGPTSTPTDAQDGPTIPTDTPASSPPPGAEPAPTVDPTPFRGLTCPAGMVAVHGDDPTDIDFCIDAYEVTVIGDVGSTDQYRADAEPTLAVSESRAGVTPTVLISYDQAAATCANTVVYTSDGTAVGRKRIALSSEWRDAADGVPGQGGSNYPYGQSFDENVCATLTQDGEQVYSALQPTGSLPGCVSPFGLFDQSGNAWEWADSGMTITVDGWFELADGLGFDMRVDELGVIRTESLTVGSTFRVEIVGVQPPDVQVDGEGYLYVDSAQVNQNGTGVKGYLKFSVQGLSYDVEENFLPVKLARQADGATYRLELLYGDDGATIPDKRGCAYYTGSAYDCGTASAHLIHFHDFDGTISFRCVSEPIEDWISP